MAELDTHFDSNNIITGSAAVYQAPIGTAIPVMPSGGGLPVPALPTIVGGVVTVPGWTPLGFTDAGIKFGYDPSYKDITVDELMSPVDVLMTAEKLVISFGLAELTLGNLQRILSTAGAITSVAAGVGVAGTSTLQVGGQQTTQKYAYLLIGNGPQGFPRMFNVFKAVATSKLDMTYKRGEKVMTPTEFTALGYTVNPAGSQLFQIVDKTANGS